MPPYVAVDFPTSPQGYYFFTTTKLYGGMNYPPHAFIIDGSGDIVFSKKIQPGGVTNFRVWPDGRMSYASNQRNIFLDSAFNVIDTVECVNGIMTDPHDIQVLENGHYLLLGEELLTMDLSNYYVFNHDNSPGSPNALVRCSVLQELDSAENLVWEWHLADHFDFLEVDTSLLTNLSVVDWSHTNAIDQDDDGNILISSRNFNQIAKIDRNADTIIWRLGGVNSDFTFVDDPGFFLQHDCRRIANGNITLYDDSKPGEHPARGVEYSLDEVAHTATAAWSRSFDTVSVSSFMGGMHRADNGNSVISWGRIRPGYATFSVYLPDSTRLCELAFPDSFLSYRTYYFDDLPFTLHRPVITCIWQDPVYELTASAGSASFTWSTGDTGQIITAGAYDTVWVEIPVGSGGFLRSEPFVPADHCLVTAIPPSPGASPAIYPNPAGSSLHVLSDNADLPRRIQVIDPLGKILFETILSKSDSEIPLQGLQPGCYFIRIDRSVFRFVKD